MNKLKLKKTLVKLASKSPDKRRNVLRFMKRKGLLKVAKDKKRMVIMVGPPASGKGYFLERESGEVGKGLPESTKGLFTDQDIPDEKRGVEESDNDLRAIQYYESLKHFDRLKSAYKSGESEFKSVLEDMWYKTKDGDKRNLGDFVNFEDFDPEDHKKFFMDQSKAFYKNMRGWHDDVDKKNEKTGKIKERFKDQAREHFEKDVRDKLNAGDKELLIVDSAGEDIDAQDFEGQIAAGKNAGYEVTVIALEPEKEDTNLANMTRGFVFGKRMVDQQDIDNYYDKYEKQIEKIKKAAPHNFLNYKKPALSNDDRKALKDMMKKTPDGKPTFLEDPSSDIRTVDDLSDEDKKKVKGTVLGTLFEKDYEIDKDNSFGLTMKDLPKNKYFKAEDSSKEKDKSEDEDKQKGKADQEWLEQRVENPETGNKVKIKTLKSKPKDSREYEYYQKLKQKRDKEKSKAATVRVASRAFMAKRIALRKINEVKNGK